MTILKVNEKVMPYQNIHILASWDRERALTINCLIKKNNLQNKNTCTLHKLWDLKFIFKREVKKPVVMLNS